MKLYMSVLKEQQKMNPLLIARKLNLTNSFNLFNRQISACPNKIYQFKSNDFCLNGHNCTEIRNILKIFDHHRLATKIDCRCPANKMFKCGKYYCTSDSIACDFIMK